MLLFNPCPFESSPEIGHLSVSHTPEAVEVGGGASFYLEHGGSCFFSSCLKATFLSFEKYIWRVLICISDATLKWAVESVRRGLTRLAQYLDRAREVGLPQLRDILDLSYFSVFRGIFYRDFESFLLLFITRNWSIWSYYWQCTAVPSGTLKHWGIAVGSWNS